MNRLEAILVLFGILFIIIFLVDYFAIKRKYLKVITGKKKSKKNSKKSELTELTYLIKKFNLDKKKLKLDRLLVGISIINGIIISLVSVVIMLIDINMILQLAIGFFLLIALIYSIYEILGRYLVKVGYSKNGK